MLCSDSLLNSLFVIDIRVIATLKNILYNYFEAAISQFGSAKKELYNIQSNLLLALNEDPSLRIKSFAIINIRGVSTNLN